MRAAARTMPQHYAKTESRCGEVSEQLQARRACGKCCWSAAGTLARALVAAAEQPAPADGATTALITALAKKPRVHGWDRVLKLPFFMLKSLKIFFAGRCPAPRWGSAPDPTLDYHPRRSRPLVGSHGSGEASAAAYPVTLAMREREMPRLV